MRISDCSSDVCSSDLTLVPTSANKPYDMKELIAKIVDDGDFFELQPNYAGNIVTGFGRVGGSTVGIVANQPMVLAGCLDIDSARKAGRFVRFCACFNIPNVTFVAVPGFLTEIGMESCREKVCLDCDTSVVQL